MKMTIEIKKEIDLREVLLEALSNGIHNFYEYGIDIRYDKRDYIRAAEELNNPCWEDVLTQMIFNNKTIIFLDTEGDETSELTLDKIQSAFKLYGVNPTFTSAFNNIIDENADSNDADILLQCMLYGDVIFG